MICKSHLKWTKHCHFYQSQLSYPSFLHSACSQNRSFRSADFPSNRLFPQIKSLEIVVDPHSIWLSLCKMRCQKLALCLSLLDSGIHACLSTKYKLHWPVRFIKGQSCSRVQCSTTYRGSGAGIWTFILQKNATDTPGSIWCNTFQRPIFQWIYLMRYLLKVNIFGVRVQTLFLPSLKGNRLVMMLLKKAFTLSIH